MSPTVPLELVDYPPPEVWVVYGIVLAERGSVEVEDHRLVAVVGVVTAKIVNERRYLALEFDVERFDDIEASVERLTGDNPVDIRVVVHAYADSRVRVNVCVRSRVESGEVYPL